MSKICLNCKLLHEELAETRKELVETQYYLDKYRKIGKEWVDEISQMWFMRGRKDPVDRQAARLSEGESLELRE